MLRIFILVLFSYTAMYSTNTKNCGYCDQYIDLIIMDGNYDAIPLKTEFWNVLDNIQALNCESLTKALNIAGYLKYTSGELNEAKRYFFNAENLLLTSKNDKKTLAQNQVFIGLVYILESDYKSAISYIERSLKYNEELGDTKKIGDSHLNLGLAYLEFGDTQKAKHHLTTAIEKLDNLRDMDVSIGYIYHNLARLSVDEKNYTEALKYIDNSKKLWTKNKHLKGLCFTNQLRAKIHIDQEEYDKSIPYLFKALEYSDKAKMKIQTAEIHKEIGDTYEILGNEIKSMDHYMQGLTSGKFLSDAEIQGLILKLSDFYYRNNDRDVYNNFISRIIDILNTREESGKIVSTKLKYKDDETTNLESEVNKNEETIQIQYTLMLIILSLAFSIIYFIYASNAQHKKLSQKIKLQNNNLTEANKKLFSSTAIIRDQNIQLQQTNKELKNFAFIASHDLKSPLRTILSFIALIKRNSSEKFNSKEQEFLKIIETAGANMTALIDDLLKYATVQENGFWPQRENSTEIIETTLQNITADLNQANAVYEIRKPLPDNIYLDKIKIQQVVQNILTNAIKYRSPDRQLTILIYHEDNPDEFIFHIKDNGIGIASQDHERIFGMFEKVSNKNPSSTGIGLATCRKIVERHGGKIWVSSNLIHGSRFSFSIPKNLFELSNSKKVLS